VATTPAVAAHDALRFSAARNASHTVRIIVNSKNDSVVTCPANDQHPSQASRKRERDPRRTASRDVARETPDQRGRDARQRSLHRHRRGDSAEHHRQGEERAVARRAERIERHRREHRFVVDETATFEQRARDRQERVAIRVRVRVHSQQTDPDRADDGGDRGSSSRRGTRATRRTCGPRRRASLRARATDCRARHGAAPTRVRAARLRRRQTFVHSLHFAPPVLARVSMPEPASEVGVPRGRVKCASS
jgi:hypothetical protein